MDRELFRVKTTGTVPLFIQPTGESLGTTGYDMLLVVSEKGDGYEGFAEITFEKRDDLISTNLWFETRSGTRFYPGATAPRLELSDYDGSFSLSSLIWKELEKYGISVPNELK